MPWSGWRKIANNYRILASVHEPPRYLHLFAANRTGNVFHRGDWADDRWVQFGAPHGWSWGFSAASWGTGRIDVVTMRMRSLNTASV
jgi:hypothetical protein